MSLSAAEYRQCRIDSESPSGKVSRRSARLRIFRYAGMDTGDAGATGQVGIADAGFAGGSRTYPKTNRPEKMKQRYPLLLGTTSYIIPDDILPNAAMLAPLVDDIELVLFESPDVSNIPTTEHISELSAIAAEHDCGFTVHFPTDRRAGSADAGERTMFHNAALRIIDRCAPLSPRAWILHLEGISPNATDNEVSRWCERCAGVISDITQAVDDPATIAVENLGYPWRWHDGLTREFGLSLCCDVGHLWLYEPLVWADHLNAMLPRTRVIHCHGVEGTRDHLSLSVGPHEAIRELFRIIRASSFHGVITLEVFNERDFRSSMEVIENQ